MSWLKIKKGFILIDSMGVTLYMYNNTRVGL